MEALQIFLFGNVRIVYSQTSLEVKLTRTAQVLLAYLLIYRSRSHSREVLAGLFWADHTDERARSCLNTALWRLRRALELEGISPDAALITPSASEVSFNQESNCHLDIAVFEDYVRQALAQPIQAMTFAAVQQLEQGLQLYRGDLLEGFYDDWVLRERERLYSLYLSGLTRLMHFHQQHHDYEKSLIYGQQILQHDPLREEIHREVMRLYIESDQLALAARQYQVCHQILEKELSIAPMPETQGLYSQIVASSHRYRSSLEPSNRLTNLQQALQQLQQARQNFDQAHIKLQRATQLVEYLIAGYQEVGRLEDR